MLDITRNRNILFCNDEAAVLRGELREAFISICKAGGVCGHDCYSVEYIKKHYSRMWELFNLLGGAE